jgi:hypothetical protein
MLRRRCFMGTGGVEPRASDIPSGGERVRAMQAGEINLLGQRFHSVVASFYTGLGILIGNALLRWLPDGQSWVGPLGVLLMLVSAACWIVLWRRTGKGTPA